MTAPEVFRLTTDGERAVRRTYGGAALYESLKAARAARSQMTWQNSGPRIQQLRVEMYAPVPHLAWEDVTE